MAHLNLLPWRAELRKERETRFAIAGMVSLAITVAIFFGVYTYIESTIAWQKQRNAYLQEEIKQADEKIAEIKDLATKRKGLFDRMDVIQKLQGNRHQVVHLFDEMVNTLPGDLYYRSFVQNGDKITLKGTAKSNALVSEVMQNIDASPWLKNPSLKIIRAEIGKGDRKVSEFEMSIQQENPNAKKSESEEEL